MIDSADKALYNVIGIPVKAAVERNAFIIKSLFGFLGYFAAQKGIGF